MFDDEASFEPKSPDQKQLNNIHNYMMSTKAYFAHFCYFQAGKVLCLIDGYELTGEETLSFDLTSEFSETFSIPYFLFIGFGFLLPDFQNVSNNTRLRQSKEFASRITPPGFGYGNCTSLTESIPHSHTFNFVLPSGCDLSAQLSSVVFLNQQR